ncbi:MAG: hypothetical protein JWM33_2502 [Caulobacteraceae bacterium]|nr:hypothetical protein [Caulobacteraceae bacterium]
MMSKLQRIDAPQEEPESQPRRTRWRPNWIRISMLTFCLAVWWLIGWGVVHGLEMFRAR